MKTTEDRLVVPVTVGTTVAVVGLALTPAPTLAAAATVVDQMATEVGKIDGIYDAAVPIVLGTTLFAAAVMILKKLIYA